MKLLNVERGQPMTGTSYDKRKSRAKTGPRKVSEAEVKSGCSIFVTSCFPLKSNAKSDALKKADVCGSSVRARFSEDHSVRKR